jgi:hypothetical protein
MIRQAGRRRRRASARVSLLWETSKEKAGGVFDAPPAKVGIPKEEEEKPRSSIILEKCCGAIVFCN